MTDRWGIGEALGQLHSQHGSLILWIKITSCLLTIAPMDGWLSKVGLVMTSRTKGSSEGLLSDQLLWGHNSSGLSLVGCSPPLPLLTWKWKTHICRFTASIALILLTCWSKHRRLWVCVTLLYEKRKKNADQKTCISNSTLRGGFYHPPHPPKKKEKNLHISSKPHLPPAWQGRGKGKHLIGH